VVAHNDTTIQQTATQPHGSVRIAYLICLFVSLSTCISQKPHGRTLPYFCAYWPAVAQSSSGGVAIRYVLPDLWMASRFHTAGLMARRVYF